MKKWSEVLAERHTPEEIKRTRERAQREVLLMTLRELRQEAGLTQVEAAEVADTTQSTLSRIESGALNPSVEQLRAYVEALGGALEVVAVMGNKRITLAGV